MCIRREGKGGDYLLHLSRVVGNNVCSNGRVLLRVLQILRFRQLVVLKIWSKIEQDLEVQKVTVPVISKIFQFLTLLNFWDKHRTTFGRWNSQWFYIHSWLPAFENIGINQYFNVDQSSLGILFMLCSVNHFNMKINLEEDIWSLLGWVSGQLS